MEPPNSCTIPNNDWCGMVWKVASFTYIHIFLSRAPLIEIWFTLAWAFVCFTGMALRREVDWIKSLDTGHWTQNAESQTDGILEHKGMRNMNKLGAHC
jgi:hypothetical protein